MNEAAANSPWVSIALLPVGLLALKWVNAICRRVIKEWAASNDYQLLKVERRYIRVGPFMWIMNPVGLWGLCRKNTFVYYVKVLTHNGIDHGGHIRHAWLRLSTYTGFSNYDVEVRWDEKHDQHLLASTNSVTEEFHSRQQR